MNIKELIDSEEKVLQNLRSSFTITSHYFPIEREQIPAFVYLALKKGYRAMPIQAWYNSMNTKVSPETPLAEIPQELRDRCEAWMVKESHEESRAFDLAVYCAHELELTSEEEDWIIPIYLTELAEELFPDELPAV